MTDVDQTPSGVRADLIEHSRTGMGAPALQRAITDHLRYSIGRPAAALRPEHYYRALALAVRDRMQDNRVASTQTSLDLGRKVTCYLSAEFLMGPQLGNNLLNLGIEDAARDGAGGARARTSTRCWPARRNRGWATAASAGSPRATSTRWPPSSARPSATASATSSASSTRRSTTAGRSRRPTTGWSTETLGRSPSPT